MIFPGCAGVATAVYVRGELHTDYYAPIDRVWKACVKTARDMKAREILSDKEFRDGTVEATIDGVQVVFSISYKEKNITTVGIRVGMVGDKDSSRYLHDLIEENLK